MFQLHPWKAVYRTDTDNLLEDFYLPALKASVSYDRAVGYFTAQMLSYAAQGISALVENDGTMRLVFGGEIDDLDAHAISEGYDIRALEKKLGLQMLGAIDNLADALANKRLEALSWMVAQGRLDIKVALKRRGMYHEKIGIFTDAAGNRLVFQGSANETVYALVPDFNFESINVFPTWRTELAEHFQPYVDGFDRLWLNQTRDTYVVNFPEAVREKLIKISVRTSRPPRVEIELDVWRQLLKSQRPTSELMIGGHPTIPVSYKGSAFDIAKHQREALNAWRSRDYHGIFEMATGSGKTVTSIYGVTKLFEKLKRLFVVVAVPYQPLADQWVEELSLFGISALKCYESSSQWTSQLTEAISLFEAGALKFYACVVVNRSLESDAFQMRISRIPGDSLVFIGDECHYHSAQKLNAALPLHARFRLGLSATPQHYFDSTKTDSLTRYYGEVAFTYSLADALNDQVLTPYRYFVHFVELNAKELEDYLELSAKISKAAAQGFSEDTEVDGPLKTLLFKRARLLGNAENKLEVLSSLLQGSPPTPQHLFYCGDGIDVDPDNGRVRQVDRVSRLLHDFGWTVAHFTAEESPDARRDLLQNFRIGIIDGLVAIRCLDEGVDVPGCRVAYILASSRNPKQFIQRRGRILRKAPNKTEAVVHDFLVRLPQESGEAEKRARDLLVAELARVAEFGRLATNRTDVYKILKPLLQQYDLEHHFA